MLRRGYHPKAFLALRRNVRPGLEARTKIASVLERKAGYAKVIARETGLSYSVVLYHLHLMEAEGILARKGRRSYVWGFTGAGQQRLTSSLVEGLTP